MVESDEKAIVKFEGIDKERFKVLFHEYQKEYKISATILDLKVFQKNMLSFRKTIIKLISSSPGCILVQNLR